jgi:hypothetical protein
LALRARRLVFVDTPGALSKRDSGAGSFDQYGYDLRPKNARVTMRLAGSDPCQDELARVLGASTIEAFIAPRTPEEERTDAPVAVRLFVDHRMTPVVGFVPRGLEAVALEAVARLERAGAASRVPAGIVKTRHGLRVELLMGRTR